MAAEHPRLSAAAAAEEKVAAGPDESPCSGHSSEPCSGAAAFAWAVRRHRSSSGVPAPARATDSLSAEVVAVTAAVVETAGDAPALARDFRGASAVGRPETAQQPAAVLEEQVSAVRRDGLRGCEPAKARALQQGSTHVRVPARLQRVPLV